MTTKRVLLVDDDPDTVEFVTAVLENEGMVVLLARNGVEGLKAARAERPDLIVLDVHMPKKDGFTVFTELRMDEATREVPVIMLTGMAEATGVPFTRTVVGDFLGTPPEAYVDKPVDPEVLVDIVREVLGD